MDGPVMWLSTFGIGGLVVGLLVGRWWALLLAFLIPVAFIPAGEDSHGAPEWAWALLFLVPPALIGAAAGVWSRRRLESRPERSERP